MYLVRMTLLAALSVASFSASARYECVSAKLVEYIEVGYVARAHESHDNGFEELLNVIK